MPCRTIISPPYLKNAFGKCVSGKAKVGKD
jgi:hypothetical protein